jgi:hypothetical protein
VGLLFGEILSRFILALFPDKLLVYHTLLARGKVNADTLHRRGKFRRFGQPDITRAAAKTKTMLLPGMRQESLFL